RMMQEWTSPIYAFFHPVPDIKYSADNRQYHVFHCFAKSCKKSVNRFTDKKDAGSTGNLHKHARKCWGKETIAAAMSVKTATEAREILLKSKDGSLPEFFRVNGNGKLSYSHRQHTKTQTSDRGFKVLMKTGRPEYYLPSPRTVSRDVRTVFAKSRQRIAGILQRHKGRLHFATDAWTSPNHHAYMAVTVHFEHNGEAVVLILDVVEVPKSHTGLALAEVF
ncbi:hypothetical protein BJ165DRAFT_1315297, partial [Panaeolus papilionaceus]